MSSDPQDLLNRVLQPGFRPSVNFFESDQLLRMQLQKCLSDDAMQYLEPLLQSLGKAAAQKMDALSLAADQNPPQLRKRDAWGTTIDEIQFHPSYWALMQVAVDAELLRLKWEPHLRKRFHGHRHKMGFALGLLYAMSESGQYCPLCMTDGVAHLIDQFAAPADRDRLLPHIYTNHLADFYTGAMFLTEKAGGSDVGANIVRAELISGADRKFALHGEKWFCSNVNAQIIFALARTDAQVQGTRGLSIFLVERDLADGGRNPIGIVRLKNKLGTRSMASGECELPGTIGTMVGPEFNGFQVMTEMINLSRMYNSVAAVAGARRALIEAYQFLSHRKTFGKVALEHALVRSKLWELGSKQQACFALLWRAIAAMDQAEAGDKAAAELLRLLTPLVKRETAAVAVYICRESMELMGGMGYIEDTVMPKVMRDVMVLPIWEGAGNIMLLDMLRASTKSQGMTMLQAEIRQICSIASPFAAAILAELDQLNDAFHALMLLTQDEMEYQSQSLFERLTRCYEAALILQETQISESASPLALEWLLQDLPGQAPRKAAPDRAEIDALLGWKF